MGANKGWMPRRKKRSYSKIKRGSIWEGELRCLHISCESPFYSYKKAKIPKSCFKIRSHEQYPSKSTCLKCCLYVLIVLFVIWAVFNNIANLVGGNGLESKNHWNTGYVNWITLCKTGFKIGQDYQ